MDAEPWTYRVSVADARREGRVEEVRPPEAKTIPDPRRFVTLEACVATPDTRFAVFAFGVGVKQNGAVTFFDSDEGDARLRIERSDDNLPNGCFRGAVALPKGVSAAQVAALRVRAFTRKAGKDEPPLPPPPGPAHLVRVNKLFFLKEDDMPGPNLLHWTGNTLLPLDGAAAELPVSPGRDTKGPAR
jgi:hypothetical protein